MLTPQEIQDKKFEKAMFGGYDMGQIDQFLDEVLGDYTSLYKENATLKAKMRVLVDKIEEYRAVDEEMRKTLYTAQVTAKDMTDKAQQQADSLLSDARREADHKIAMMRMEINAEQRRLVEAQKTNTTYINKIKEAMRRNIELMDSILDIPQQDLLKKDRPAGGRPAPREGFEVVLPEEAQETRAEPAQGQRLAEGPRPVPQEPAAPGSPGAQGGARLAAEPEPGTRAEAPAGQPVFFDQQTETGGEAPGGITQEMETRFFEVDFGAGKEAAAPPREPAAEDDPAFTPKPRFDFSDIRFGKDYSEDDEK